MLVALVDSISCFVWNTVCFRRYGCYTHGSPLVIMFELALALFGPLALGRVSRGRASLGCLGEEIRVRRWNTILVAQ